uniref:Uncharacterized protein n=1 Tax=Anser cygnoides TaxID=8845 RepID=A0A8B9E638_ANSCY
MKRHPVGCSSPPVLPAAQAHGHGQPAPAAALPSCLLAALSPQEKGGETGAVTWLHSCCSLLGCRCRMGNVASLPLGWSYLGARVTAEGFTPRLILSLVMRSGVSGRDLKSNPKNRMKSSKAVADRIFLLGDTRSHPCVL